MRWPSLRTSNFCAFSILILSLLLSCTPIAQQRTCIPAFPDRDGWYGGDGAYSVVLPDRRVLWLFGDSFVSKETGRRDRRGMQLLLGTTVATSSCDRTGHFHIHYHLKRKGDTFVSFFDGDRWFWPQAPFMVAGILYLPLLEVAPDPTHPGPFKFRVQGHRLAMIKDMSDPDPTRWPVAYGEFSPPILPNIHALAPAAVVSEGYVYFFPLITQEVSSGKTIPGNALARMSLENVEKGLFTIEYWTKSGNWERTPSPNHIPIVLPTATSEMSVRYVPAKNEWLALYLAPERNGDRLLSRRAANLAGPWSEPRTLLAPIPEVDPHHSRYDPKVFCYAGKEHPEFSSAHQLVITYVCNAWCNLNDETCPLTTRLDLYRPVVVILPTAEGEPPSPTP